MMVTSRVTPGATTAIVFDMDGVLVDGERLHYGAARRILAEHGIELDTATYAGYMGMTGRDIWQDMRNRFGLTVDFDAYRARYDATLLELYQTDSQPLPGARAALDQVRAAGLPCALASSSRRHWVQTALTALGFHGYFQAIVTGDEVRNGKPDPEIYRAAAIHLGVAPTACMAVEDSPAGIESARRAGMRVAAVRSDFTQGLALEGADHVLDSLEAFDLAELLQDSPAIESSRVAS